MISSQFGDLPGIQTAQTTYEQAFSWGGTNKGIIKGEIIDAACVDAGASPTYRLRPGLVLGRITSTGKLTNYGATATDGSQVAVAILLAGLRMQDVYSGSTADKYYGVLVGGPVQASRLYGLDSKARGDMFGRFIFDDDLFGVRQVWKQEVTKTANYTVVAADSNTLFNTVGNGAALTFTLPSYAPGLRFKFENAVGQNMIITVGATGTIWGFNNAAATTITFSTANNLIGAAMEIVASNTSAKWYAFNSSAGANTVVYS